MNIKNNVHGKTYRILLDMLQAQSVNALEHRRVEMETIVAIYAQENEEEIFYDKGDENGN